MMRRSMRIMEREKSEEELEDEIRAELKDRMQQKENEIETDGAENARATPKKIEFAPVSDTGSIGKWLNDKEKRREFLLTSSVPRNITQRSAKKGGSVKKGATTKLPKPSTVTFNTDKPVAARKLKMGDIKECPDTRTAGSSRSIRKRSPQRTKIVPPKSPFKFHVTRKTPEFKFQQKSQNQNFQFGQKENVEPSRVTRKTVFKHVVGNYNSQNCKYEQQSIRERRMAYSRKVDERNLVKQKVTAKRETVKRDVKQRTRDVDNRRKRMADRVKNTTDERRARYMKNRPL